MTQTFIAILLVIASTQALPDLARLRGFAWLRDGILRANGHGGATPSLAQVVWLPALVVVATAVVQAALQARWFGLLEFAFMVSVLFVCWGPRDLDADIEAVLKAPDNERRVNAAQALNADGAAQSLPFHAASLVAASFSAALSRYFGVLFWFVVAGPTGAIAYRLVQLLARSPAFRDAIGGTHVELERAASLLDWAPAHLLAFSVALVSDFDAVVRSWRDYHAAHGNGYFTLDLGFLAVIARAGVDADVSAEEGSIGDPLVELADARVVLRRVMLAWLAVLAVVVIGGWAG